MQPEWLTSERMLFASDQSGFWNLYSYDPSGIYCVYPDEAEYCGPAWGFGSKYYCVLAPATSSPNEFTMARRAC